MCRSTRERARSVTRCALLVFSDCVLESQVKLSYGEYGSHKILRVADQYRSPRATASFRLVPLLSSARWQRPYAVLAFIAATDVFGRRILSPRCTMRWSFITAHRCHALVVRISGPFTQPRAKVVPASTASLDSTRLPSLSWLRSHPYTPLTTALIAHG